MRGRIHEASAEFEAARRCYADVIAIVPDHLKASVHLGRVTLYLGSARLAEKILRDAVRSEGESDRQTQRKTHTDRDMQRYKGRD